MPSNDLQDLILECADHYAFRKTKVVQLKIFFCERGVYKENLDYCLAKTYDYINEIEDSGGSLVSSDRQTVDGNFKFETIKKGKDKSFFLKLDETYDETLKRIKTKRFKQKYYDAWVQYYRDHVTVDNLADLYDLKSKSTFTNSYKSGGWFSIVKEEVLGHLVEDALSQSYYEGFTVIGGNTEPDLVKDNIMVEVKARSRREKPTAKMLNQKEVDHLDKGGKLQLCIVTFKPGKCFIELYQVLKKEQEIKKLKKAH